MSNSVLDAIVKLPRYVRVLSTNGIDENNAIVLVTNTNTITKESKDKPSKRKRKSKYNYNRCRKYYLINRDKILDYSHRYYQENRLKILEQKKRHNQEPKIKEKRAVYAKQRYERIKAEAKTLFS